MKVGLWAEIRRLKEIEKLSHRAIARRLGCCAKTVKKALALERPPDRQSKPASGQPVGSVQAADRRLVGPHAGVVGRPRAGGDSPWRAGLSGRHLAGAAVPPASPSAAGPDLSRGGLATRRGPASGLGRVWPDPPGQHLAAGLRLRGGLVLQPPVLHRILPGRAQGRLLPGLGACPGIFRRHSAEGGL